MLLRIAVVIVFGLFAVAARASQQPGPEQPIPFSHKWHAGTLQLKCATCHKNADPGERMGLPVASVCMQCHAEIKTESPAIKKLAAYDAQKRAIPWERVYEIPFNVMFSHRAHLTAASACTDCHGQVTEIERMYRVGDISMKGCIGCHQAKGASTDCSYCHEKPD